MFVAAHSLLNNNKNNNINKAKAQAKTKTIPKQSQSSSKNVANSKTKQKEIKSTNLFRLRRWLRGVRCAALSLSLCCPCHVLCLCACVCLCVCYVLPASNARSPSLTRSPHSLSLPFHITNRQLQLLLARALSRSLSLNDSDVGSIFVTFSCLLKRLCATVCVCMCECVRACVCVCLWEPAFCLL